jgi:hypothetical protein
MPSQGRCRPRNGSSAWAPRALAGRFEQPARASCWKLHRSAVTRHRADTPERIGIGTWIAEVVKPLYYGIGTILLIVIVLLVMGRL